MGVVWPSNMPSALQNYCKSQVLLVQALENSWTFRVVQMNWVKVLA